MLPATRWHWQLWECIRLRTEEPIVNQSALRIGRTVPWALLQGAVFFTDTGTNYIVVAARRRTIQRLALAMSLILSFLIPNNIFLHTKCIVRFPLMRCSALQSLQPFHQHGNRSSVWLETLVQKQLQHDSRQGCSLSFVIIRLLWSPERPIIGQ